MIHPRPGALSELIEGLSFKQTRQSYIFNCPRCNKRDKLYMFKESGGFKCFVCAEENGFEGRPEYALAELLNLSLREIREKLYGEEAVQTVLHMETEFVSPYEREESPPPEDEPLEVVAYPIDFHPIGSDKSLPGLRYLEYRGVSLELAQKYDIYYCPKTRRVIFPVSHHGKLYGWQARTIGKESWIDAVTGRTVRIPKALTSPGLRKERALMFWDRLDGSDHAVLCEGPMDAIMCDLVGGNVAALGKDVSDAQLKIIRESGVKRIYLALDPDAVLEMDRIARELFDLDVYLLEPAPGFKDLGEMTPESVLTQFQKAEPYQAGFRMRTFLKPPSV